MMGRDFERKKLAQLVIPVHSTFQNDLHPPIGGPGIKVVSFHDMHSENSFVCRLLSLVIV